MTSVSTQEAKTQLAQLLDSVAKGEKILITRRGRPAAMLTPPSDETLDVSRVIEEMLAYRKKHKRTLGDNTVRELIEEGRRY